MNWVGVMCWASGEVRRGHTSYDSLRRIQIRIQIKAFSTPRRPSAKGGGFKALRLMPPTPTWEAPVCNDGDTGGKLIADFSLDLQNESSQAHDTPLFVGHVQEVQKFGLK